MSKIYFNLWDKEKDIGRAISRHEGKLKEAHEARHDRITRLLNSKAWLRNYIASCCQVEWLYGKWMFRRVTQVGDKCDLLPKYAVKNKRYLNELSLKFMNEPEEYHYGEWVDINRILAEMAELTGSMVGVPVWLPETKDFFSLVGVTYPALPKHFKVTKKVESKEATLYDQSLIEPVYSPDLSVDQEETLRCINEVKGAILENTHPQFSYWLRSAIWETFGNSIKPGQTRQRQIVPGSFIHEIKLLNGRWYVILHLDHADPIKCQLDYQSRIKEFVEYIRCSAYLMYGNLEDIIVADNKDCFLEVALPLQKHIFDNQPYGSGLYRNLSYANNKMRYCHVRHLPDKKVDFYFSPCEDPIETHRGISAIAGYEVESLECRKRLVLSTVPKVGSARVDKDEIETKAKQDLINKLWK